MENVVAFNNELSGLYESKPPISKAKMAAITRAAMRAIKFYKHVVQSVEKFILKCKPEYKVPGLYVIDSIVRQSRHQYGPEKDVFAPRFARNMKDTFANLFRCAPEDKSRIIRVLNLWQKNNVFAPDVIQPIFDLADPNHPIYSMPPPGASASLAGPSGSGNLSMTDVSGSQANGGLNTSGGSMDMSLSGSAGGGAAQSDDKLPPSGLADLSNNNLKQLLNDPNVLRQLQTLQNFTKFKQDDKQHNLRLQEEAFEKHLQNVLKNSASTGSGNQDANDFNKEVEFVSEEQKIEVITLDGNDSRSPTPDRDRYKRRRSRSRSRSRDRGARNRRGRSRSRSRSRSPRSNRRRNSRDRERTNRDKEKEREHERERRKKGLPDLKKEHLSVCSTTLWVGHLSKLVYQEELSDTFGEYGDIVSIDQIVPRGCAFIVMNRRQDAHKAMQSLKNYKLQGRAITISWAAGKGVKSKEWKDFWDLELGVTYIPWSKLDEGTDFDTLEEGGMFDEDSMPGWMKEKINKIKSLKEGGGSSSEHLKLASGVGAADMSGPPPALPPGGNPALMFGIDTTQPPPGPPPTGGPPPMLPMVPGQYSMAPPMGGPPRMMGPHMGMPISGIHMPPNIVPPHAMMMMPGFGMAGPGGAHPMGPPHMPHMGAHPTQFPPPPGGPPASAMPSNVSSDDQMDIEMEDEEGATMASASATAGVSGNGMNFSQPPPAFAGASAENSSAAAAIEPFSRERNRGGAVGSRWGGRGGGAGPDEDVNEVRWRENGGPPPPGAPHNFPDSGPRNPGGPHRPDFMNDYDKRGGPGPRGGAHNFNGGGGDFHMQNRFNQPTNLMQMRIPPPNAFNQRGGPGGGGGPPMFMRGGQGGPGGQVGGRQQGPGFFNRNNPFDRDINEGFGGRGRGRGGARGGGRGGRGGGFGSGRDGMPGGNWSDEDGEESGFKRRGAGGIGGNRFRDREGSADRFSMRDSNSRGGRRGPGGPARERNDSDRDQRAGRGPSAGSVGRRVSRDDNNKKKPSVCDTEEDWDLELEEYDAKSDKKKSQEASDKTSENRSSIAKTADDNSKIVTISSPTTNDADKTEKPALMQQATNDKKTETKDVKEANETESAKPHAVNTPTNVDEGDKNTKSVTPLYDELPPPKVNTTNKPANETTTAAEASPATQATDKAPTVTQKPLSTPAAAAAETVKPASETAKPALTAEKPADTMAKTTEQPPPAATNTSNNTKEAVTQSNSETVASDSKFPTTASDKVSTETAAAADSSKA